MASSVPQRRSAINTDRDPVWDALKDHSREKFDADRARFLAQAETDDDGGWTKHTEFHWSRMVNGERLDYWPSRKKFQFRGRVSRGLRAMHGIIRAPSCTGKDRNNTDGVNASDGGQQ